MESLLRSWLALQCQMIAGAESGLAVLDSAPLGSVSVPSVHWPADAEPGPRLVATLQEARRRGQLVAQGPREEGAMTGAPTCLALPIQREGRIAGAVGIQVRGLPAAEVKALAGLLGHGIRGLELLLETRLAGEDLRARIGIAATLLDHRSTPAGGHALCAELAHALGCSRVSLGLLATGPFRSGIRMLALSTSARFQSESSEVRDLAAVMQEAIVEDAVTRWPDPEEPELPAHAQLQQAAGARALCAIPLVAHGQALGALVCEWTEAGDRSEAVRRARDVAELCGPLLDWMRKAEEGVPARIRAAVSRRVEGVFGADRRIAVASLAVVGALVAFLLLAPASYRVAARASLEGRVQRALVAGVDGYIAEAHARAGDVVQAGDLLASLDDRDLRLEHRRRASEKAQLEKQYREALAGTDRTQVSLLQARIEQADARLALATEELGRTRVEAPFDGIVLRGDLDRALGSPVELGSVLFEIAPLDGYRIIVEVDGRDIADVAVGQTGKLALEALPGETLPLEVERVTSIATQEDGRSYFRVEAVLGEPRSELRPGMEGIAKIDAGRRTRLWIWTHGLVDWLRLRAWSWLP